MLAAKRCEAYLEFALLHRKHLYSQSSVPKTKKKGKRKKKKKGGGVSREGRKKEAKRGNLDDKVELEKKYKKKKVNEQH